jgi:hypothetical protein
MFDQKKLSKIKNENITRWRIELSCFHYDIQYRAGKENVIADTLSRICGATGETGELYKIQADLCHPGISGMYHFVRSRNLPYSTGDIKQMTSACKVCSQVKPNFVKNNNAHLKKQHSLLRD